MKRSIFALAFFTLTLPAFGQGVHPLIETWKYNPAKFITTDQVPNNWTMTFTGEGQTLINTAEGVDDQGRPFKTILKHIYDGKPYPVTGEDAFDTPNIPAMIKRLEIRLDGGRDRGVLSRVVLMRVFSTDKFLRFLQRTAISNGRRPWHGENGFILDRALEP
jgi:hypothetical protein